MFNTIQSVRNEIITDLLKVYDKNDAVSLSYFLLMHVTGFSKVVLLANPNSILDEDLVATVFSYVARLKNKEPYQQILGYTEFYNLKFNITPDVLIPRPETEELVDLVLKKFNKSEQPYVIIDVGTGSGCIAISLQHHLKNSELYALDISNKAIEVARKNALINNVKIIFFEYDVLKSGAETEFYFLSKKVDAIVSNPPYVKESERGLMDDIVLNFEPDNAIFVSDGDPLVFYRNIAKMGLTLLKPGGWLFFEINENLHREMVHLVEALGYKNIEIVKDLFGKWRILHCRL